MKKKKGAKNPLPEAEAEERVQGLMRAHMHTHIHTYIYTWREEGKVAGCDARIRV